MQKKHTQKNRCTIIWEEKNTHTFSSLENSSNKNIRHWPSGFGLFFSYFAFRIFRKKSLTQQIFFIHFIRRRMKEGIRFTFIDWLTDYLRPEWKDDDWTRITRQLVWICARECEMEMLRRRETDVGWCNFMDTRNLSLYAFTSDALGYFGIR